MSKSTDQPKSSPRHEQSLVTDDRDIFDIIDDLKAVLDELKAYSPESWAIILIEQAGCKISQHEKVEILLRTHPEGLTAADIRKRFPISKDAIRVALKRCGAKGRRTGAGTELRYSV